MSPLPPTQPLADDVQARLKAADIWIMANSACYSVLVRNGCMAVAQRDADTGAYTSLGSSAYNLEGIGFAYLQWQGDRPFLYRKNYDPVPATPEQLTVLRQFSADAAAALGLSKEGDA